jgi:RNA-directed DNA polymerase
MLGKLTALPAALGRPQTMLADNGYFSAANVAACAAAGIEPLLALGRTPHHPSLDERFAAAPPAPENPTPLDHLMAARGFAMVRYADDFVVLCRSPQEAVAALAVVQEWTAAAGLLLHRTKTRLVAALTEGFDFLGYRFAAGRCRPREKSLQKLKDTVRATTRRTSGHSLPLIIADLNRTLRGWFEYFKHSHRSTFPPLDGWIRRRLRNILRKRSHRKGISRGYDNIRWPNAFFAEHGLFNLQHAHVLAHQSSCG